MMLRYAHVASEIGPIFLAATEKGLCSLRLLQTDQELETNLTDLRRRFPGQQLVDDEEGLRDLIWQVQRVIVGDEDAITIARDMPGTEFQRRVWDALTRVPWGKTYSYAELADLAGQPRAIRAAASACARNPVAFVVPCHRIVSSGGGLGGFFHGLTFKRHLIERERDAPVGSDA